MSKQSVWTRLAAVSLVAVIGAGLAGCEKKPETSAAGPAETAGKQLDKAAAKAAVELNKAAEKAGEGLQNAGKKMQSAAKEAQDKDAASPSK
ncbi:MAG: hypothetical protein JWR22_1068 [Herminiimonas sp.]|nr:hypothetical protein [Herminiimonas sp.]